jgi:hypothetical protein
LRDVRRWNVSKRRLGQDVVNIRRPQGSQRDGTCRRSRRHNLRGHGVERYLSIRRPWRDVVSTAYVHYIAIGEDMEFSTASRDASRPVNSSKFGETSLHVAIEAGALVRSDDAGVTWCDRVSSSPKDTHSLAVHSQDPTRLHSAAGDGYFESVDDGDSWRRMKDGLEHQYCWSVAVSFADPTTLLLTAATSAYGAHYKESACSFIYRRSENNAW